RRHGSETSRGRSLIFSPCPSTGKSSAAGPSAQRPMAQSFFPNKSPRDRTLPQVLETQQHGEHPFKLAVEMDLLVAKPLQLVRVERLAERLFADQRPVGRFLPPILEPILHLSLAETTETLDISGGRLLALLHFVGIAAKHVCPPSRRILAQCRQCRLVGI